MPSLRRIAVYVIVVAAMLSPLATGRDSFPLSTYPMYASARGATADLVLATGIALNGEVKPLGLDTIANSDDPLIVESLLRQAIRSGTAEQLCESIASRSGDTVATIEIVTERHVLADIARDPAATPLRRTVHARCDG